MKASMSVNNPTDAPSNGDIKQGKLQGAIRSLNIREKPDINSRVLYILTEGMPFSYMTLNDPDWLEIITPLREDRGYAMSKYVREYSLYLSGDTS